MRKQVFRRGQWVRFTGDGLTAIPAKVIEDCGGAIPTEYLIKLHGDTYARRCGAHQLTEGDKPR